MKLWEWKLCITLEKVKTLFVDVNSLAIIQHKSFKTSQLSDKKTLCYIRVMLKARSTSIFYTKSVRVHLIQWWDSKRTVKDLFVLPNSNLICKVYKGKKTDFTNNPINHPIPSRVHPGTIPPLRHQRSPRIRTVGCIGRDEKGERYHCKNPQTTENRTIRLSSPCP